MQWEVSILFFKDLGSLFLKERQREIFIKGKDTFLKIDKRQEKLFYFYSD